MLYLIAAALGVILDQLVKAYTRSTLELGETMPFLPHILGLTHAENTGAAFSVLSGGWARWLLVLISAAAVIAGCVVICKRVFPQPWAQWSLAAVVSGAAGNLIDRALFGTVTDMFQTLFMDFAIFNVADSFVVCGGISLCLCLLLHWKDEDKPAGEAPHDTAL